MKYFLELFKIVRTAPLTAAVLAMTVIANAATIEAGLARESIDSLDKLSTSFAEKAVTGGSWSSEKMVAAAVALTLDAGASVGAAKPSAFSMYGLNGTLLGKVGEYVGALPSRNNKTNILHILNSALPLLNAAHQKAALDQIAYIIMGDDKVSDTTFAHGVKFNTPGSPAKSAFDMTISSIVNLSKYAGLTDYLKMMTYLATHKNVDLKSAADREHFFVADAMGIIAVDPFRYSGDATQVKRIIGTLKYSASTHGLTYDDATLTKMLNTLRENETMGSFFKTEYEAYMKPIREGRTRKNIVGEIGKILYDEKLFDYYTQRVVPVTLTNAMLTAAREGRAEIFVEQVTGGIPELVKRVPFTEIMSGAKAYIGVTATMAGGADYTALTRIVGQDLSLSPHAAIHEGRFREFMGHLIRDLTAVAGKESDTRVQVAKYLAFKALDGHRIAQTISISRYDPGSTGLSLDRFNYGLNTEVRRGKENYENGTYDYMQSNDQRMALQTVMAEPIDTTGWTAAKLRALSPETATKQRELALAAPKTLWGKLQAVKRRDYDEATFLSEATEAVRAELIRPIVTAYYDLVKAYIMAKAADTKSASTTSMMKLLENGFETIHCYPSRTRKIEGARMLLEEDVRIELGIQKTRKAVKYLWVPTPSVARVDTRDADGDTTRSALIGVTDPRAAAWRPNPKHRTLADVYGYVTGFVINDEFTETTPQKMLNAILDDLLIYCRDVIGDKSIPGPDAFERNRAAAKNVETKQYPKIFKYFPRKVVENLIKDIVRQGYVRAYGKITWVRPDGQPGFDIVKSDADYVLYRNDRSYAIKKSEDPNNMSVGAFYRLFFNKIFDDFAGWFALIPDTVI